MEYVEIFSPVVNHSSIRVLLAMVAHFHMELEQMDVETTFLHGKLGKTIYMKQPIGYVKKGDEQKVCLLKDTCSTSPASKT